MTEAGLQESSERNWLRVPEADRSSCVWYLRGLLEGSGQADAARRGVAEGFGPWFHMTGGMNIRNALRRVLPDDRLPTVEYPGGHSYQNWDDFYMAALRQAIAPREGES